MFKIASESGETPAPQIGIIGGTGVGNLPFDAPPLSHSVKTPWGEGHAEIGNINGVPVVFVARHGVGHRVPPHRVNYRANIATLRALGVRALMGTTAVGGLRTDLFPGDLVLLDDFIDFTGARENKTFFDAPGQVVHTDFTEPYSRVMRQAILEAAGETEKSLRDGGTYLCADGPRYESPAEVRLFASWGADVVGMTGIPEATLAREAGLHYAGISLVTNQGVGISETALSHEDVEAVMRQTLPRLLALLTASVVQLANISFPPIGTGIPLPGLEE